MLNKNATFSAIHQKLHLHFNIFPLCLITEQAAFVSVLKQEPPGFLHWEKNNTTAWPSAVLSYKYWTTKCVEVTVCTK